MKNILLLLAITLLATACSKGPATQAKFAVTIGGLTATGSVITQIVITGQSDSGKRFSRVLTSGTDAISLELPNEAWNFLAMAWEGADLDGKVRCAVSREKLDGQEVTVSLVLTNAKCFDGTLNLTPSETVSTYQNFKDTQWKACRTDLSTIATAGESCIHDMSVLESKGAIIGSMEVAIVGGFKTGKVFVPNGEKMASTCATIATMGTINARYPAVNSNYFFPLVAIGFAGTSCDPISGFSASFLSDQKIKALDSTPSVSMFASFTDVDVCGMKNFTTISAVGAGTAASPHALCNLDQLKHWQENFIGANQGAPVALMADLDLLPWIKAGLSGATPFKSCMKDSSTFIPLGMTTDASCNDTATTAYSGNFHGQGYTISHMRMDHENSNEVGFFRRLSAGSNVTHLRFSKPLVRGADFVGVVFGDGTSGGNATKGIKINDGEVRGADYVGMIAGAVSTALAGPSNFHANGRVEGNSYVGGITGIADDLEEVSFSGQVTSDSGMIVGGIAGHASTISKAIQSGLVIGLDRIGGIAGVISTSINDVRVNGAIIGTLDSGSGNRHGGIAGVASGASITRAAFLGSLYSYNGTGGGVGSISGDNSTQANTYTIQAVARGGGENATAATGSSSKASAMWAQFCLSGSLWNCGDTDSDFTYDVGEGEDLPRLAFEVHTCSLPANVLSVADQIGAGRGTAANPISLCNQQQLAEINTYSTRHYRLEQDLSLAFSGFTSITSTFTGVFDGNGHALHGYINESMSSSFGLFTNIASGATVKNLDLANFRIDSSVSNISILGTNSGTVENIRAIASDLKSDDKWVGAIVDINNGTMSKIFAEVTVEGLGLVGGVAGENYGTMSDILSKSRISGNGSSASGIDLGFGGVVGVNSQSGTNPVKYGLLTRASFAGDLEFYLSSWDPTSIGGLVGYSEGSVTDSAVEDEASIVLANGNALNMGSLIGKVATGAGTHARLVSNAPFFNSVASTYSTSNYGPLVGEYVPNSGVMPSTLVSYFPLLEYMSETITATPNFTWDGTATCTSNSLSFTPSSPATGPYYVLRTDELDKPGTSTSYNSGTGMLSFTGTSAAACNAFDEDLSLYTDWVPANTRTVGQLAGLGFNIGNFESGTPTEKNAFFKAYVDQLKGLTPTHPLWIYDEGGYRLFRFDE